MEQTFYINIAGVCVYLKMNLTKISSTLLLQCFICVLIKEKCITITSLKVKIKRRCLQHLSHDTRFTFVLYLTRFISLAFYIETNVPNDKIAQNNID